MLDIDKRIAQVYAFCIAAFVSLFSWIAKVILEGNNSIELAYAALLPNLLLICALQYLVAQRRDLIGFAAYLCLLEKRLGVFGFQTGLGAGAGGIRVHTVRKTESNDPVPYVFWALFLISALMYIYAWEQSLAEPYHLATLLVPLALILPGHLAWRRVIPKEYPQLVAAWQDWESQLGNGKRKVQSLDGATDQKVPTEI